MTMRAAERAVKDTTNEPGRERYLYTPGLHLDLPVNQAVNRKARQIVIV
jgi:hypothetical protein